MIYLISLEEGKTPIELEEAKVISRDKMADHAEDKMADPVENEKAAIREEKAKNTQRIRVMIFLSVCYSANTGGSGTLTGKKILTTTKKDVLFTYISVLLHNSGSWNACSIKQCITLLCILNMHVTEWFCSLIVIINSYSIT